MRHIGRKELMLSPKLMIFCIAAAVILVVCYKSLVRGSARIREVAERSLSKNRIPSLLLSQQIKGAVSKDALLMFLAKNPPEALDDHLAGLVVFRMDELKLTAEDRYHIASVVPADCKLGKALARNLEYGGRRRQEERMA